MIIEQQAIVSRFILHGYVLTFCIYLAVLVLNGLSRISLPSTKKCFIFLLCSVEKNMI